MLARLAGHAVLLHVHRYIAYAVNNPLEGEMPMYAARIGNSVLAISAFRWRL